MLTNNFFLPPPYARRPRPNYVSKQKSNYNTFSEKNTIKQEHSPSFEFESESKIENNDRNIFSSFQQTEEDVLFEIFGLKIYFDDLLLICIIFFLYQEGIQDEYLFIALILLLLS